MQRENLLCSWLLTCWRESTSSYRFIICFSLWLWPHRGLYCVWNRLKFIPHGTPVARPYQLHHQGHTSAAMERLAFFTSSFWRTLKMLQDPLRWWLGLAGCQLSQAFLGMKFQIGNATNVDDIRMHSHPLNLSWCQHWSEWPDRFIDSEKGTDSKAFFFITNSSTSSMTQSTLTLKMGS